MQANGILGVPKVIYFAGPLFTQAERQWNLMLADRLEGRGFRVILPQRLVAPLIQPGHELPTTKLFERCVAGIDESDLVLAVLDGPDADSGTSFECGYAWARGKQIVGLRTDLRNGGDGGPKAVNLMLAEAAARFVEPGVDADWAKTLDSIAEAIASCCTTATASEA